VAITRERQNSHTYQNLGTVAESGGCVRKKKFPKKVRKFRKVDLTLVIIFCIENFLITSLPGLENAKYATGAGAF
jgi:hypothetical protein